jgi:hypothetical protein
MMFPTPPSGGVVLSGGWNPRVMRRVFHNACGWNPHETVDNPLAALCGGHVKTGGENFATPHCRTSDVPWRTITAPSMP